MLKPLLILTMALSLLACAGKGKTPSGADTAGDPARVATPATPVAKPEPPAPTTAPAVPVLSVSEQRIAEATDLFDKGDFAGTLRKLQASPEIWTDSDEIRVRGHKLMAFSYCVTQRRIQCRQQFDQLLKIRPAHELTAAEAGHPLWGPVFAQARKAAQAAASKPAVTPAPNRPAPKPPVRSAPASKPAAGSPEAR